MNKTVDINERTLAEEKKAFTTVCKVFEVICVILVVVFALLTLGLVGVIAVMGAEMADVLVLFVNSIILLFGMTSALNFGRAVFKSLKSGETPFRYDIADKVKGAALALLMCSFLSIIVQSISDIFSEAFSDLYHYYFFIAVGNIFIGLLLGIMSYVMNFGCKLQQESDETL